VGFLGMGMGGRGGGGGREMVHWLLNYNKPPNTVNNQKRMKGSVASGDVSPPPKKH